MEQLFSEKVDKFSNVVEAFLHFSSWTGLTLISTTAPNQKASFEHSSFLLTSFCSSCSSLFIFKFLLTA